MTGGYYVPHNQWVHRPEYTAAIQRVLWSGQVGQGREVQQFEQELAAWFRPGGAACCVSSGTAALWLAHVLMGSPITIPTYACASLWLAAREFGVTPGLLDCDEDLNTPGASVVVHTYGALSKMAKNTIEDFTHAPGAPYAGAAGRVSVISFGATKPLGVGAGGALLGPPDVIAAAHKLRDYDAWDGEARSYNCQMSDIHAAMGRERLARLDEDNAWRRGVALRYAIALAAAGRPAMAPVPRDVFYRYVIQLADVAKAKSRFHRCGVEAINPLYPDELLHRRVRISGRHFPVAEALAQRTLSLPIWPGMSEPQVESVVRVLRTFGDLA